MLRNIAKCARTVGFCTLSLLLFPGCVQQPTDASFQALLPARHQDFLDLQLLPGELPRIGQSFFIEAINKTDDCVVFPNDFGLQIFAMRGGRWVPIPYKGKYAGAATIVMEPRTGLFPDETVDVYPDFSKLQPISGAETIRVVLTGTLCYSGTASGNRASDYLELEVQP